MKRIMLIGNQSAGKTTLGQYLTNQELLYKKTQTIELLNNDIIDTPGEYLEQRNLYKALVVTSVEAEIIVFVKDSSSETNMFAPGLASMFAKPVIGIVTKSDIADSSQIEISIEQLRIAGAKEVFIISCFNGMGFSELLEYLQN